MLLIIFVIVCAENVFRKFDIHLSVKIIKIGTYEKDSNIYSIKITNKSSDAIIVRNAGLFSTEKQRRNKTFDEIIFHRFADDYIKQNNSLPILIEPKSSKNIFFKCPIYRQGIFIDAYKTSYNNSNYSDNLNGRYIRMNRADEIVKATNSDPFLRVYKSCSFFL